jgi:hypothetical protein
MPELLQLVSELDVIVYFAVVDHGNATGLIPHRLGAAADIDDRQSPTAESDLVAFVGRVGEPIAGAIRPTARHQISQSPQEPMILASRAW